MSNPERSEIEIFLNSCGLSAFAAAFAQQNITEIEDLFDVSDHNMETYLGLKLGDRAKLRRGLADHPRAKRPRVGPGPSGIFACFL